MTIREAGARDIADMVQDLNAIQNWIVAGDVKARDEAARQFDLIESEATDSEVLSSERNSRAAIVYLLSGGASTKLRALKRAKLTNESLSDLLEASLQYAEGSTSASSTELIKFDARTYPALLGGHLALVQGSSLIGKDNDRAVALFDLARLLMPGSLVEEAALRREIAILDPKQQASKLTLLAYRYVGKYASSPFAPNFWDILRRVTLEHGEVFLNSPKFDLVYDSAPAADRLEYFLGLTRRALLLGDLGSAEEKLARTASATSDPAMRKRVDAYQAVLAALTKETGSQSLQVIKSSGLSAEDAALTKIVASVTERLEAELKSKLLDHDQVRDERTPIEAAVRQSLERSDDLLKRAGAR